MTLKQSVQARVRNSLLVQLTNERGGTASSINPRVFEAAVDHDAYVIGIDADQALALTKAEQRDAVITSVLKNVGVALLEAFDRHSRGVLPYGEAASLGVKESAVGIVDNDRYLQLVPERVRLAVAEAADGIASGTIVVPSELS